MKLLHTHTHTHFESLARQVIALLASLCIALTFSPFAFADSGYTSMTPWQQDNSWKNKPIFKTIAPASKTEYGKKAWGTGSSKVAKLYKNGKKIVARAEKIKKISGGAAVVFALGGQPEALAVASLNGLGCEFLADCTKVKFNDYREALKKSKNARYKVNVFFKWTDAKNYKYKFKVNSFYQYKVGKKWKRCSKITTSEFGGQATTDRWG